MQIYILIFRAPFRNEKNINYFHGNLLYLRCRVPSSGRICLRVGTGGSNVDVEYQNNDRRFFKFVAEAGKRLQLSVSGK